MGHRSTPVVAIVGPGAVGTSLGILLRRAGHSIGPIVGRTSEGAEHAARAIGAGEPRTDRNLSGAGLLLVTTPDAAIPAVVRDLASSASLDPGCLALHCSGYLSSSELEPLRSRGARLATLHPLQSFASPEQAVRTFSGTYCFYEGDDEALDEVEAMIRSIGGIPVRLDRGGKALYHAAASVASNFLVSLLGMARTLMEGSGVGGAQGLEALLPLVRGTLSNIEKVGIPAALTGPIARGDVDVVAGHLVSIGRAYPDLVATYREMARRTLELAREKGSIDREAARRIEGLLEGKGSA
jgi:predicted short-subunit dehydrogenase-like oxidoreductase (DUF2520 family)